MKHLARRIMVTVIVVSALGFSPAADALVRPLVISAANCGHIDMPGLPSSIRAFRVTCSTARSLARSFNRVARCYQRGCSVAGFRCHRTVLGYESYHARCTSGRRLVTFDYGA